MFVNKLNERTAESKFAVAVGSMDANPQDCEMFSGNPQDMDASITNFKSNQPFSDLIDCDFLRTYQRRLLVSIMQKIQRV